jgi:hypothetical protein
MDNNNNNNNQQIIIYKLFLFLLMFNIAEQFYRKGYLDNLQFNCKIVWYHVQEIYDAFDKTLELCNNGGLYLEDDDDIVEERKEETTIIIKEEIRYEMKYLDEIKNLKNEYTYTWLKLKEKDDKSVELLEAKQKEIKKITDELNMEMVRKGLEYIDIDDLIEDESKEEIYADIDELRSQISTLEEKYVSKDLEEEAKADAHKFIVKQHLDALKNSFIIEKTPLGNVLMYYNNSRESFEYYSDNTIPYRYLETVSRKYVKTFNCRYLYVDMEYEISVAERKLKEILEKKAIEEEEIKKNILENHTVVSKKNVFAKFKSYNKESGTGRVNTGAPPKNSIPNSNSSSSKATDNKVILKENANRYTCEGRMSNFSFLKKPKREAVDKKYAMSFADFKKFKSEENKTL